MLFIIIVIYALSCKSSEGWRHFSKILFLIGCAIVVTTYGQEFPSLNTLQKERCNSLVCAACQC